SRTMRIYRVCYAISVSMNKRSQTSESRRWSLPCLTLVFSRLTMEMRNPHGQTGFLRSTPLPLETGATVVQHRWRTRNPAYHFLRIQRHARGTASRTPVAGTEASFSCSEGEGKRKGKGTASCSAQARPPKIKAEEGIRAAFYVDWDAASFSSLREYSRQIDLLFPDWLHVLTPDGHLQAVANETNKLYDVMQGSTVRPVDDKVMPFLKSEGAETEVFPMVNNFNGTDWVNVADFLNDP